MGDTGIVDFNDPARNMYGCMPCPKCGGKHRFVRQGMVECDDCGRIEPATFQIKPAPPAVAPGGGE